MPSNFTVKSRLSPLSSSSNVSASAMLGLCSGQPWESQSIGQPRSQMVRAKAKPGLKR